MSFIFTNLPPLKTKYPSFSEVFYSLIPECTELDIAVGYITADSLAELKQIVAFNDNIKSLNLIIGMHYWDRFTKLEYSAATLLQDFLMEQDKGCVSLVTPFRFHGKMYSFSCGNKPIAGVIGSNNLSSILDSRNRIYEASAIYRDEKQATDINKFIKQLFRTSTRSLTDCGINENDLKKDMPPLNGIEGVSKFPHEKLVDVGKTLTNISFELPFVKKRKGVNPQSDLNCYFGKGRKQKSGLVPARPWYEVEVMVSTEITRNNDYPQSKVEFDVITHDGWAFKCYVSGGDGQKSLRSVGDLTILGRWLKGHLENAGVLKVGELVVEDTLVNYGRTSLVLTKTTTPNLWYLDFGVNK